MRSTVAPTPDRPFARGRLDAPIGRRRGHLAVIRSIESTRARRLNRLARLAIDFTILAASLWLAFALRFEGDIPREYVKRFLFLWPYVAGLQMIWLGAAGVHDFAWRYIGLREASRIGTALVTAAVLLLVLRVGAETVRPAWGYAIYAMLPVGAILIDLMVAFLGITGARALWRSATERAHAAEHRPGAPRGRRTLLVGAGQVGLLMAREIERRPDVGHAVGFVDDDPTKRGQLIHGLRVLGTLSEIGAICRQHRVSQALVTIANAPGGLIRRVRDQCDAGRIDVKTVPGLYEIAGGQVSLSRVRPISIEDLLRRDPVRLDSPQTRATIEGQSVLITGAGGSIGLGLCRQVLRSSPRELLLVERAEGSLFTAHQSLLAEFSASAGLVYPLVADVGDERRIDQILSQHRPSLIFHAAAHKHVPMMEANVSQAIKNNVLGTRILADAAHRHGVERFVMISTDKAVNPTSVMGCTKRIAEMYVQALSKASATSFVTVRFGNVLASAGSVVPIFQKQIEAGGPVTVTHPEMKRYFMTIPEACQLVIEAGGIGKGGEIFILDMGDPVKIVDLARDLIRLSGLRPDEDIGIEFTGIRPGEKLYEELSVSEEVADKTRHPKIFIGSFRQADLLELTEHLDALRDACDVLEPADLLLLLARLVPEYAIPSTPVGPPTLPAQDFLAAS